MSAERVVLDMSPTEAEDLRRILLQACNGGVSLHQEAKYQALGFVSRLGADQ